MKRIGIFAGSFDPIHDGHIAVALSCVDNLELEKLFFMVESEPWGSKSPIDISHRQNMLEVAVNDFPKLDQIKLEDKHFNIESTLPKLENSFPETEMYFVFGADIFMNMNRDTWKNIDKLLKYYIVVIERNKITESEITKHAIELGVVIAIFPSPNPEHSSTDIRMYPHKKEIWVPKSVGQYIDENNLYSKP